jgi:voltage-gated potassium channel
MEPLDPPATRPPARRAPPGGAGLGARLDHLLREGFLHEDATLYRVVTGVIVALIFVSVVSVTLASVQPIYEAHRRLFDVSEAVIVTIFTLEYLINIYVARDRRRYVFGVWGIVDLLAILPSLLLMFDLRALQVARVLRVLRFLRLMRILRVLKLAKVAARQGAQRRGGLSTLKMDVQIYLIALVCTVTILSTLAFYAEEHVPDTAFTSIPQAMWWCIATLTTTGYGDMYPVTVWGRLVGALTMLVGLALFGLLINVVGKAMLSSLFGASDLERHDEAAQKAAALLAARRERHVAAGLQPPSDTSSTFAIADLLGEGAPPCACGQPLQPDWRVCPYCGSPR